MDFLFEILVTIYLELAQILVPEHTFKKWQETLLKVACILISLITLGLIIAGIAVLIDTDKLILGIALLAAGGVLLITQVVLFIIVLVHDIKKHRDKKRLPPLNENQE